MYICMEDARHAIKPGMIVRVHQKIKDVNKKGEEKERIQVFEGTILAIKHGNEPGATVTVRKVSGGIGVEKIFPINSPVVAKIERVREMDVRQSRAYYLRDYKKKLKERKKKVVVEKPKAEKAKEKDVEVKEEKVEEKK